MGRAYVCDRFDDVFWETPSLAFQWQRVPQGGDLPAEGDVELCPQCRDPVADALANVLVTAGDQA